MGIDVLKTGTSGSNKTVISFVSIPCLPLNKKQMTVELAIDLRLAMRLQNWNFIREIINKLDADEYNGKVVPRYNKE
jgi:hypothetical protein